MSLTYVLGAQKNRFNETVLLGAQKKVLLGTQRNRLIETVLLSTHNIYFG